MIRIITDSTSDITFDEAKKMNIDIVPINVRFDDEEFVDMLEISHEEFYNRLSVCTKLPQTSQPSPAVFSELFTKYIEAGDDIVGIFISSELSGTYQSAMLAAADVEDDLDAEGRIHIVDSRMVSIGTSVIIREAVKFRDMGMSAENVANKCVELTKHVKLAALVGSLKYLKIGGRLSSAEAFAGTLLNITPVISVEDGKVVVIGKARGRKAAEKIMLNKITEEGIKPSTDVVFGHINCVDYLEPFFDKSSALVSDYAQNTHTSSLGCSVGTHVGPGSYGFAYIENYEEGLNSKIKTA